MSASSVGPARRVTVLGICLTSALMLASCRASTGVISGRQRPGPSVTTGTTTPPSTTLSRSALAAAVVGGTFVHPVVIGGLRVTPPARRQDAPLGLDFTEAKEYVGLTGGLVNGGPPSGQQVVGFGDVTLSGVASPAGTPSLRHRPAWVGIVLGSSTPVLSCPAEIAPRAPVKRSASTPPRPIDNAVIFYGQRGQGAVLYRTAGTEPCNFGTAGPTLAVAEAQVPVPWEQAGPTGPVTTVTYQAPVCAQPFGVGAGGNVRTGVFSASVTVVVPFDRSHCRAMRQFTTTVTVFPPDRGPGAPPPPDRVVLEHAPLPASIPPALAGPITG